MSYLDSLPEFNNKAILVQSTLGYQMAMAYLGGRDIGLELILTGLRGTTSIIDGLEDDDGPFNRIFLTQPNEDLFDLLSDRITWYNQLLGVSNDTDQSDDTRLKCLTELVDQARLNEVPLLPYNSVITPQTDIPPSALVIHNETTGVEGPGFLHIGPVELAKINSARQTFDSFAEITGEYTDNASLVSGFATKEGLITPSGNAAQFWNGTKSFAQVAFNQLTGVPTTLAGYGISASDTLFNDKYLQLGSQLQTLNTTVGTPLTTTTTVIEGFGRLQNQVSARELSLGNPAANGYVLSSTTAGVRSWIPAPTGTAVTNISLTGTNGITGAVTITAGVADIVAGTNVTGMLKGDTGALVAATEMTDYIGITGATNGDTILFTGGVATWAPGLTNPMDTLGDVIYGLALGATEKLAGNTTVTNKFLRSTGDGTLATAPSWQTLVAGDIPEILISQVTGLSTTLDNYLLKSLALNTIFMGNTATAAVNSKVAGDLTAVFAIVSGTNEAQFTIANEAVTYAKIQNVTTKTILGRYSTGDGIVEELYFKNSDFSINALTGEIGLTSSTPLLTVKGDLLTRDGTTNVRLAVGPDATFLMADTLATTGNKWVAMSGDATIAVSGALTIASGAVTLAKMANMATASFIGRTTAGTGVPEILTATQATAMLNLFSTSATTKGLVPGSNGVGATYYLDATGNWSVPAGGGGSGTVTSANQYSIPYYSVSPSGTTVIGLAPQTTNGVYFLRANVTASAAVAPSWIGSTGNGNVVLATSPTLTTPTLGVALATSINGLTITSSTGTLTIDNGSTLATSGAFSTTLTATATTTLTLPTTGTLATLSGTETFANKTLNGPKIGTAAGSAHFHMHFANSAPTGLADYITVFGDTSPNKKLGFLFETDVFESYFQFEATTTSKTYTFPDLSGTVALLANAASFTTLEATATASLALGTASSTTGQIILRNSANANLVTLQAGATSTTTVYTLPLADGFSGQVLRTDGFGSLSWITASGTGTVTSVAALTIGTTGTNITSTVTNSTTTPVITLNIPDANGITARGVVSTGAQIFGGLKTFAGGANFSANSVFAANTLKTNALSGGGIATISFAASVNTPVFSLPDSNVNTSIVTLSASAVQTFTTTINFNANTTFGNNQLKLTSAGGGGSATLAYPGTGAPIFQLPLTASTVTLVTESNTQTLTNKTLGTGTVFSVNPTFNSGIDLIISATTGTRIGQAGSRIALFGATPDLRPTNAITAAAFVANTSLIANDTATFGGYTIGKIAAALIRLGILT